MEAPTPDAVAPVTAATLPVTSGKESNAELAAVEAADPKAYAVIKSLLKKNAKLSATAGAGGDPMVGGASADAAPVDAEASAQRPESLEANSQGTSALAAYTGASSGTSAAWNVLTGQDRAPTPAARSPAPAADATAELPANALTAALSRLNLGGAAAALGEPAETPAVSAEAQPAGPATTASTDERAVNGLLDQVKRLTGKDAHRLAERRKEEGSGDVDTIAPASTASWSSIVEGDPAMRIIDDATRDAA